MSTPQHELTRDLLRKQLGGVPDRGFLDLIWGVHALQSDRTSSAESVLGSLYPAGAVTADLGSPYAIYPWELETLVNELLASPKLGIPWSYGSYTLGFRHWWAVARAVNTLRALEDQEYSAYCDPQNILREMQKIAARQFEWQRGFLNVPQFYRSAFLYGGDLCSSRLESEFGTSIGEMSLIGFAIFAALQQKPSVYRSINLADIGADRPTLERVLGRICRPLGDLRDVAHAQRQDWPFTAYRPSVLRQFPCISVEARREVVLAPIPDLVLLRVTSGIFYDVVGGGGAIRNEYGRRFEDYCWNYFKAQLPNLAIKREWKYAFRKQPYDTPDLLVSSDGQVAIAIECKATKMTVRAKLHDQAEDEKGFNDLAKGIYQIWRFFSHSRQGLTGSSLSKDAIGMLLTLDGWMVMGGPLRAEVIRRAEDLAAKDGGITVEDRKSVFFCQITDLESTLADADEETFLRAAQAAAQDEHEGWLLSSVHSRLSDDDAVARQRKPYPFDDLAELLPWWGAMKERKRDLQIQVPG